MARGKGVKASDWIRSGRDGRKCQSASVTVTINNGYTGNNQRPYKPDLYSDRKMELTIRRNITKSSSTYHILKIDGKWEKVLQKQIAEIAQHFNIQADNPVQMMTQETTKDFLTSKTPKAKFNFFRSGTQITLFEENLNSVQFQIGEMESFIKEKMEIIANHKDVIDHLHRKVNEYEVLQDMKKNLILREKQLVWCDILPLQLQYNKENAQLQSIKAKVEGHQAECGRYKEDITKLTDAMSSKKSELDQLEKKMNETENRLAPLRTSKMRTDSKRTETRQEIQKSNNKIKQYKKDIKVMEEHKLKNADDSVRMQIESRKARVNELEEKLKKVQADGAVAADRQSTLRGSLKGILDNREQYQSRHSKMSYEVTALQRDLKDYERRQQSNVNAFGSSVAKIRKAILAYNKRGMWRGECPIGPVGDYLSSDPKWRQYLGTAERLIHTNLFTYLYFNEYDRESLYAIMKQHISEVSCIISYNYSILQLLFRIDSGIIDLFGKRSLMTVSKKTISL